MKFSWIESAECSTHQRWNVFGDAKMTDFPILFRILLIGVNIKWAFVDEIRAVCKNPQRNGKSIQTPHVNQLGFEPRTPLRWGSGANHQTAPQQMHIIEKKNPETTAGQCLQGMAWHVIKEGIWRVSGESVVLFLINDNIFSKDTKNGPSTDLWGTEADKIEVILWSKMDSFWIVVTIRIIWTTYFKAMSSKNSFLLRRKAYPYIRNGSFLIF